MQRVWLDTEFIRNNLTSSGLISIALTSETGKEYYAVNGDMDLVMSGLDAEAHQWMLDNVWPHLPGGSPLNFDIGHPDVQWYFGIRRGIEEFFESLSPNHEADLDITLYVNRGAQDVIRLHTLWDNDWGIMPGCIPTFADDMARLKRDSGIDRDVLPRQDEKTAHHSLHDARHEKMSYLFMEEYRRAEGR